MTITNNAINCPDQAQKGDLLVGRGSTLRPAILPSTHTPGMVLTLDPTQPTDMKWAFSGSAASQASFFAYPNAATSGITGDGTTATIVYNTVVFNFGSGYNASTGIFTAPISGLYIFAGEVFPGQTGSASGSTGDRVLNLATTSINTFWSVNNMSINQLPGCYMSGNGTTVIYLTAGQTARTQLTWNGYSSKIVGITGPIASTARSYFCGACLQEF